MPRPIISPQRTKASRKKTITLANWKYMRRFRGYTAPRGVNAEGKKAFQSTVTGAAGDGNRRHGSPVEQSPNHSATREACAGTRVTPGDGTPWSDVLARARRLTRSRSV